VSNPANIGRRFCFISFLDSCVLDHGEYDDLVLSALELVNASNLYFIRDNPSEPPFLSSVRGDDRDIGRLNLDLILVGSCLSKESTIQET